MSLSQWLRELLEDRTVDEQGRSPAAGPSACLPAELSALLDGEGWQASRAEEVTTLGGARVWHTYRIELTDGSVVKGRVLRDAEVTSRMRRWLPMLRGDCFPPLLATSEDATIEAWRAGRICLEADDETTETAGALLGEVHGLISREDVAPDDSRLIECFENVEGWTEELRLGGGLSEEYAGRVLARATDGRPAGATWGLQHGDFCLENLLIGDDGGLCCIDNPTVAPGLLESDLARTFYRWPMTPRQREYLLRGYRRYSEPTRFLEDEDFWMIAATLRAAAFRLRADTDAVDVPLRVLKRHVR